MKNSELKRLIKSAYSIEASRKNEFIKNYQRRELNYRELCRDRSRCLRCHVRRHRYS